VRLGPRTRHHSTTDVPLVTPAELLAARVE